MKGKATHGTLGGNARQFGNSQGGGRSKHKPSPSAGASATKGNRDASNGERRRRANRPNNHG